MNISLYLSDILQRFNLDLNKVKLIRHSLKDRDFLACYNAGFIKEYTQLQKHGFAKGYDCVITFASGPGKSAKLEGFYAADKGSEGELGKQSVSIEMMPPKFLCAFMFEEDISYYIFKRTDFLSDLVDRLIIDWGKSTISWHQKVKNDKTVLAIQSNPGFVFSGYENVVL